MGFIDALFGKRKPTGLTVTMHITEDSYEKSEADKLLERATQKKQDGDLDGAIQCLRDAYVEIAKEDIGYGVETFLRLPMYLQAAGKNDEAWGEFNRMIVEGYPNQMKDRDLIPMDSSVIHDKMRLFLQREGRKDAAVRFGAMSHMYWAMGLNLQGRMDELKEHIGDERLRKEFSRLLKRAKKEDKLEDILKVFNRFAKTLPRIPMGDFAREMDKTIFSK